MMGKSASFLVLIAGVGLAVGLHAPRRADAPQPGPDLPALAQMASPASPTLDNAWPTRAELAGLASACGGCLPVDGQAHAAAAQWPARDAASPTLRIGGDQPAPLDRLRAVPANAAANPLLVPGDASLNDLPRLELAPVPEPQNWVMFLIGLALTGRRLRRRPTRYLATL